LFPGLLVLGVHAARGRLENVGPVHGVGDLPVVRVDDDVPNRMIKKLADRSGGRLGG
jgi:hypothetical protein